MPEVPCALCGEPILKHPDDPEMVRSDEHAVAKQFYPSPIRRELRERLWTVPSHKRCNNGVKPDEENFTTATTSWCGRGTRRWRGCCSMISPAGPSGRSRG